MAKPQMKDYRFAGRLVTPIKNGAFSLKSQFEDIDVNVILSVLRRNMVPIIFLDSDLWEKFPEFFKTPEFTVQYEKEYFFFKNLRSEWAKVKEEFIKFGVESMLIKSIGSLPYRSSNLDVLIKQSKRDKAEAILRELDYIQLHNVEEPYKTLFRKFVGGKSISVIHLHNKVAWINPFHDEKLLWKRYRRSTKDEVVDIPSPEDSILILTAHWFYEDKEIKLSDIINIAFCLNEKDLDWDYMVSVAAKLGWLIGLYFGLLVQAFVEKNLYGESSLNESQLEKMRAALPMWMRIYFDKKVNSRNISLPFKLPKIFGKYLHFVKTIKDNTTTPSRKLYEMYKVAYTSLFVVLFYKLKVNIRYRHPMFITISGVDGSGKSTYADILYNTLDFCELETRYCWSRVGSSTFLKPFSRAAKIFYNSRRREQSTGRGKNYFEAEQRRKDLFGKTSLLRMIGLLLLLSEMIWQYFFKITLPLFFKKVVICDRYIYDTLVDLSVRYGVDLESIEGKLFAKILFVLTPKPDISYVLLISFEEACRRRKVDVNESHLVKDQISSYQEIAKEFYLHQINTDNNKSITDISDIMIYETLNSFYGKWHKS